MIRTPQWTAAFALGSALLVGACASPYRYEAYDEAPVRYYAPVAYESGTVERIELMRGNAPPVGVGAILGGVAGGVLGHQIGGGTGNTVATIAGAIGGALLGNQIEQRVEGDHYRVTVRLDSGGVVAVDQRDQISLRVGDRVRIDNGHVYLM
jgi:outer membrane lipoprotein SlyB